MNPLQYQPSVFSETAPEGYVQCEPHSPYLQLFAPLFSRPLDDRFHALATYVRPEHLNLVNVAHGGLLFSLADSVLGVNLRQYLEQPLVTVSLTSEYYEVAPLGALIEARPILQKVGNRLVFAEAQVWMGDTLLMRSNGVFARLRKPASTTVTES